MREIASKLHSLWRASAEREANLAKSLRCYQALALAGWGLLVVTQWWAL